MSTASNADPIRKDPGLLFKETAKPRLATGFGISLAAHVVLLGLLSIPFIGLCIQYKSTKPHDEIKRIAAEEKVKLEEQARAERIKLAQQKAMQESATIQEKPKDKEKTNAEKAKELEEKYNDQKEDPSKANDDIPTEIKFSF